MEKRIFKNTHLITSISNKTGSESIDAIYTYHVNALRDARVVPSTLSTIDGRMMEKSEPKKCLLT